MNKARAVRIAKSGQITWGEIQQMMQRAYDAGVTDERRGTVNSSLSKGAAYNILGKIAVRYPPAQAVSPNNHTEWLGARHCLWEFGQFWQGWTPRAKEKPERPPPMHQDARPIEWPI